MKIKVYQDGIEIKDCKFPEREKIILRLIKHYIYPFYVKKENIKHIKRAITEILKQQPDKNGSAVPK